MGVLLGQARQRPRVSRGGWRGGRWWGAAWEGGGVYGGLVPKAKRISCGGSQWPANSSPPDTLHTLFNVHVRCLKLYNTLQATTNIYLPCIFVAESEADKRQRFLSTYISF